MTAERPTFAMYWAASCGGCDIAVLNSGPRLLDLAAAFEVVFWPCVMDAKYRDVEALPDRALDLTLFSGSIRTSENLALARLLRRKSKTLVAFGSCANDGCIPGLANLSDPAAILAAACDSPSSDNPEGLRPVPRWEAPEGVLELPAFEPILRTLDQVVPVDYRMPGCPPEGHRIEALIDLVLAVHAGTAIMPPAGSTIGAGDTTCCDECPRRRGIKQIRAFRRLQDLASLDPDLCLLEQGIVCSGPATRDGCGALCPQAGAPCAGCYGPPAGALDQGARLLSALASVVEAAEPAEVDAVVETIPDPVGQLYRFGLAGSLLRAGRPAWEAATEADGLGAIPASGVAPAAPPGIPLAAPSVQLGAPGVAEASR